MLNGIISGLKFEYRAASSLNVSVLLLVVVTVREVKLLIGYFPIYVPLLFHLVVCVVVAASAAVSFLL